MSEPAASPGSGAAPAVARFLAGLDDAERGLLLGLDSPARIQAFLDSVPYSSDPFYRCPRRVLRDRRAHCFDGALMAAAALRLLGHPPLVVDLYAERDDDHMLALWQRDGCWGAIAKSNFAGLRFREPIYQSLRELVMSYFEDFYNVLGEKSLRGFTVPLDLSRLDGLAWMETDDGLDAVAQRLDALDRTPVLTAGMVAGLSRLDARSLAAGMLGADQDGLYRPV
ncbi:MAG TPA: hypothetical protein VHG32_11655 [Thermoanaerobaculia bacterium]|jgi:hypothetical protein|nr:hypothetical protein [Thermoanaerobaculia bacterium]